MEYYLRIYPDRLVLRNVKNGVSAEAFPESPYVHARCFLGNISQAEAAAARALAQVRPRFSLGLDRTLVHPVFDLPGGLCEAEERLCRMLAYDLIPGPVSLWTGPELGDEQVRERLSSS